MEQQWHSIFSSVLPEEQILTVEPMSRHTTFGIGGPADCFLIPGDIKALCKICRIAAENQYPLFIIGGGANLLVRDKGIRGVVVSTEKLTSLRREGRFIWADAGNSIVRVARYAMEQGLAGMEFAGGIPGSIGGAAYMNAGAYGGEMSHIVTEALTCDTKGTLRSYGRKELGYAYRQSRFMETGEVIVTVKLQFEEEEEPQIIQKRMDEYNSRRRSKQPLEFRSAGSTFKRPPGYFVGEMIEKLGLKGLAVGDAQVSEKHAGFLINRGRASCQDMLELMRQVQDRVEAEYGVRIEPEVQIVGEK